MPVTARRRRRRVRRAAVPAAVARRCRRPQLGPLRRVVVVVAATPAAEPRRRPVEPVHATHQPLRVIVSPRVEAPPAGVVVVARRSPPVRVGVAGAAGSRQATPGPGRNSRLAPPPLHRVVPPARARLVDGVGRRVVFLRVARRRVACAAVTSVVITTTHPPHTHTHTHTRARARLI